MAINSLPTHHEAMKCTVCKKNVPKQYIVSHEKWHDKNGRRGYAPSRIVFDEAKYMNKTAPKLNYRIWTGTESGA